jgi:hypothetical protein
MTYFKSHESHAQARREAHLRRRIFAAKGAWQEALEALRGTADNGGFEAPKQGVQR